jgi:predicted phage-related endonuclease
MNAKREAAGKEPIRVQQNNFMLVHPEYDYLAANIDGEVFHPEYGHGLLEIKTASEYVKDEWEGDDIPNEYLLQTHHYLLVTGLKYSYVAVLIGGNKFRVYFIKRDEEIIELLLAAEKHFYHEHLVKDIPPTVDGHTSTKEMLSAQYPQSSNFVEKYLNDDYKAVIETLSDAKERVAYWTEQKTKSENLLKNALLESEQAFCGPYKVTWKTAKNGVRTLRVAERKEPKLKKSKVDSVRKYHNQAMGV